MKTHLKKLSLLFLFLFFVLACQAVSGIPTQNPAVEATSTPFIVQESAPAEEDSAASVYEWHDVSPAPDKFSMIKIVGSDVPLEEVLQAEVRKAIDLGRAPYVEFYADWCPPCKAIEANIADPLMVEAYSGTYIIQLNWDEWENKLSGTGFNVLGIPAYYEVDTEGQPTGRMITGGAWGEDIPENIAPPMEAFFANEW